MNILITGGSSGLGKSFTQNLAMQYPDATVYFTYNSSAAAAKEIETAHRNTKALHLNFKEEKSINDIAEQIASLDIDVLINNAVSSFSNNHFHKTDNALFLTSFTENILPVLKITAAFIKAARQKKSGKIITVLSAYVGGVPVLGLSEYIANKNYLLSMARSWASENVKFNIQSNCVSPEFMDTALNATLDVRLKEEMVKSHPLKKLLTTDDVAEVVQFLVTAPAHINGQNIFLDTGKN